jgi:putative ABC transport system permease protein
MSIDMKMAWRNIWRNPRRTVLTISAITFACLILVFMLSFQFGSYAAMIEAAVKVQTGHLQIQAEGYNDDGDVWQVVRDPAAIVPVIDDLPNVEAVTCRANAFAMVSSEDRTYGALVRGIDPDTERQVSNLAGLITEGTFLSDDDPGGAVVGHLLARNLRIGLGDELTVLGQGRDGSIAATVLNVRGIFDSGIDELDRSTVHMQLAEFQRTFSMSGAVHQIVVIGPSIWEVPRMKRDIASLLANERQKPPLVVLDWNELMPGLVQGIKVDVASGFLFYIALIGVVAFSILNTFLMAFFERTKEYGVMMALGTTSGRLSRLMLLESISMTMIGVLVGILLGCCVTLYFQSVGFDVSGASELMERYGITGRMYPQLSVASALIGPGLVLLITGVAAVYPALRIRKLRPVEAIAHV